MPPLSLLGRLAGRFEPWFNLSSNSRTNIRSLPYRPTPRTEARRAARRERLLQAAQELIGSEGYAGVSVAAVARRAGVGTGSVYTHFPSKGELLSEVFRRAAGREVEAAREAAASAGDAAQRLAAAVEALARRALRGRRQAWALLAEPVDPVVDAERLVFRRAYAEVLAAVLADGVAAGELPEQDVELTAAALIGAIGEALTGPLSPVAPDPDVAGTVGEADGRIVHATIAVCLRAAGAALNGDVKSRIEVQEGSADGD